MNGQSLSSHSSKVTLFINSNTHLPIKRDDFYFPILILLYTLYSKYMIVLYNLVVIKVVLHYLLGWKFSHINLEVIHCLLSVETTITEGQSTSFYSQEMPVRLFLGRLEVRPLYGGLIRLAHQTLLNSTLFCWCCPPRLQEVRDH